MALKDLLEKKLTKRELVLVPSSFDVIGDREKAVAIIDIPEKLRKKRSVIARALMQQHKNVKTVLEKTSPRTGIYRIYAFKKILGEKNTEVVHKENNCRFLVDPQKAYFSPRESSERLRLASQVKSGENVVVFFAGVGPFPIVFSRKSRAKSITGIEINPDACKYFGKNIVLNKADNVRVIQGNVTEKVSVLAQSCDRVIMPLPEQSMSFLYEALFCMKKKAVCNLYCFAAETELSEKISEIQKKALQLKSEIKIFGVNKVLPYGPSVWKYRIDFMKMK